MQLFNSKILYIYTENIIFKYRENWIMANQPISAIGTETKGTSETIATQKKKQESSQENPKVAYMGPNIGNILNGSTPQPTASAFTG